MSLRLVEWFVKRGPIKLTSESYTHHLITTPWQSGKFSLVRSLCAVLIDCLIGISICGAPTNNENEIDRYSTLSVSVLHLRS